MNSINLLQLAARNILRNKRRALLTQIVIIFGVVTILFSSAFLDSMGSNWRNAIISADLGHLQLMRAEQRQRLASFSLDNPVTGVGALIHSLQAHPQVVAVTPRISFMGLAGSIHETAPFFARAISLDEVLNVLPRMYGSLVDGKPLSAESAGGAIVGEGLARLLKVKTGDTILLTVYDRHRAMNAAEVTVAGILRIPDEVANNQLLITDFGTGAQLVDYQDEATELVVRTRELEQLESNLALLQQDVGNPRELVAVAWTDLAGGFNQASRMFAFTSAVISGIIYVVVLVTLANTVLTTVFERSREVGMLTAMGTPRRHILLLFIAESLLTGLIGVTIGIMVHAGLVGYTYTAGITVPPPPGTVDAIVLYPAFSWATVTSTTLVLLVVTVIAALYPARFAARLNPVEAIHAR